MLGILFYIQNVMAAPKCYTANDLKSAVCYVLCVRDGADIGKYIPKTDKCMCGRKVSYAEIIDPLKIIPPLETKLSSVND